jgi:predicted glycosyltransferase
MISDDRLTVIDQSNGISFRHNFSKFPGTKIIDPLSIERDYEQQSEKMNFLIRRWYQTIQSESVLFIRQEAPSVSEAQELYDVLAKQAGDNRVCLLILVPTGYDLPIKHPNIYVESGCAHSEDAEQWRGNNAIWDAILAKYWTRTSTETPEQKFQEPRAKVNDENKLIVSVRSAPRSSLVLFQVPNQVGLGHMNRMACVALALREMDPAIRVLFVVEGSSHGLLESHSLPYVTLPSPDLVNRSECWGAWSKDEKKEILKALAITMLEVSRPDIVIYDCFPSIHFAHAAIALGIKSMLCIRKVKKFEAYASDPRVRTVIESDAAILVPHWEDEFQIPPSLMSRATYVGPIVKSLPINPEPVQMKFNLLGKRVIVICGGGGGGLDTIDYFNFCLKAFVQVKSEVHDVVALLITGPLFTEWGRLNLTSDVRVLPFDPDFTSTCATSALVISQAGYNSINELAALNTPTICLPAERGFDNQFERAHNMAMEYANIDCFEGETAEALSRLIIARLNQSVERIRLDVPDGAYRAAFHVMNLLGREKG